MQNVLELDKLQLNEYGVAPLQNFEMEEIDGGGNPYAVGVFVAGYALYAFCSLVDGIYTGMKQELAK